MKKTALALLLIFAAFTWACDDGLDERASFSAGYASAFADSYGRAVDVVASSADSDGNCISNPIRSGVVDQTVVFRVWVKPNQNAQIARVGIKGVEVKYTTDIGGLSVPATRKLDIYQPLYLNTDEGKDIKEVYEYQTPVQLPLFNGSDFADISNHYDLAKNPITFIVDYKIKLVEYDTGIEDEVYVEGISVSFGDVLQEGECQ
jgi:hypothetical protein